MGTDQESLLTLEWTVRPASKFNPAGIIVPGGLTVMSIDRLSPTAEFLLNRGMSLQRPLKYPDPDSNQQASNSTS